MHTENERIFAWNLQFSDEVSGSIPLPHTLNTTKHNKTYFVAGVEFDTKLIACDK